MTLYIDPGTGSMLFTILLGVIGAGIYSLRMLFIKIKFAISGGKVEVEYYLGSYPDLRQAYGADGAKALNHFIKWGMNEGRIASENFNVCTYKSRYWDLQNAYGNNLKAYFTHYLNWRIREGRSGRTY